MSPSLLHLSGSQRSVALWVIPKVCRTDNGRRIIPPSWTEQKIKDNKTKHSVINMKFLQPVLIIAAASIVCVTVSGQDLGSPTAVSDNEAPLPVQSQPRRPPNDGRLPQPPPPFLQSEPSPARQRPQQQAGLGNLLSGERKRGEGILEHKKMPAYGETNCKIRQSALCRIIH